MKSSRSPFVIGAIVVLVLVGLGLFALARTGSGEPPAAAPPPSPVPQPSITEGTPTTAPKPGDVINDQGTTVVRFEVTGDCEGCQVTARAAAGDKGASIWSATISAGSADLELPTPNTYGLSFTITDEVNGVDSNTKSLVVLNPDAVDPGSPVTAAQVKGAKKVSACWAGTTFDTAIVQLTAARQGSSLDAAFTNPALATVGTPVNAKKATADVACPSS